MMVSDDYNPVTRHDLVFPKIETHTEFNVSVRQVVGALANWACRQSPYKVPDNLAIVCEKLFDALFAYAKVNKTWEPTLEFALFKIKDVSSLERLLRFNLRCIPEYKRWNERKNGNTQEFQFTSAYDGPIDPDNNFIDLSALERNVAMQVIQECILDRDFNNEFDHKIEAEKKQEVIATADENVRNKLASITRVQRKIVDKLMQGKSNKEIAYELDTSENTVKVHVRALFKKLNVTSRLKLVMLFARYYSLNLVEDELFGKQRDEANFDKLTFEQKYLVVSSINTQIAEEIEPPTANQSRATYPIKESKFHTILKKLELNSGVELKQRFAEIAQRWYVSEKDDNNEQ